MSNIIKELFIAIYTLLTIQNGCLKVEEKIVNYGMESGMLLS